MLNKHCAAKRLENNAECIEIPALIITNNLLRKNQFTLLLLLFNVRIVESLNDVYEVVEVKLHSKFKLFESSSK